MPRDRVGGTQSTPRPGWPGAVAVLVGVVTLVAGVALRAGSEDVAAPPEPAEAVVTTQPAASPQATAEETLDDSFDAAPDAEPRDSGARDRAADLASVPATGSVRYRRAGLNLAPRPPQSREGRVRVIRYSVRVERDLEIDPDALAREIQAVLDDPRSWRGRGQARFELVRDPARARLNAYLVTPGTTDRLCAPLGTRGQVSCQSGNRVVLNARRWAYGATSYGSDLAGYRRYLINHEFGHALGHRHVRCPGPGPGRKAPVMMQQTKGLDGCRPNPWPKPRP